MVMTRDQINELSKRRVQDRTGQKLGTVGQIWADPSGDPTWMSVKTGLFGRRESMVPLEAASLDQDQVTVPYDKDMVTNAPHIEASADEPLNANETAQLYEYYQLAPAPQPQPGPARRSKAQQEVTRSEERLRVGKESQPAGTARLRKYVVSENVHTTVPLEHDEVRLEREPITSENRAGARAQIGEDERELTLTEERPVVSKEQVPVERVRLSEEQVSEDRSIDEPVRRELVDADMPDGRQRGDR